MYDNLGRLAIYTAVFGGYDDVPVPRPLRELKPHVDFICFTDDRSRVSRGWTRIDVTSDEAPSILNRRLKILGHPRLEAYDTSLYVDSNVAIREDPRPLISRHLTRSSMALPRHPVRSCVYDEADACIASDKADAESTLDLMERFRTEGMPADHGLSENGFIARRHGDIRLNALLREWWKAVRAGPVRDQLHLPYLTWKHHFDIAMIEPADVWGAVARLLPHKVNQKARERVAYAILSSQYDRWGGIQLERLLDRLGVLPRTRGGMGRGG